MDNDSENRFVAQDDDITVFGKMIDEDQENNKEDFDWAVTDYREEFGDTLKFDEVPEESYGKATEIFHKALNENEQLTNEEFFEAIGKED